MHLQQLLIIQSVILLVLSISTSATPLFIRYREPRVHELSIELHRRIQELRTQEHRYEERSFKLAHTILILDQAINRLAEAGDRSVEYQRTRSYFRMAEHYNDVRLANVRAEIHQVQQELQEAIQM